MSPRRTFLVVVLFAIAMAWMESATVVYLRTLAGRMDPHQAHPLPMSENLCQAERVREAATMLMLLTVGWLAGRTWRSRLGFVLVAFGVWDILYYVFLRMICGWPRTLSDWDVLFLLPLPWWGPVISPVLIALLMIAGGGLVALHDTPERPVWPGRRSLGLNILGIGLALYVFMADAVRVVGKGPEAMRTLLPTVFNWPLFLVALALMSAPLIDLFRQAREVRRNDDTRDATMETEPLAKP